MLRYKKSEAIGIYHFLFSIEIAIGIGIDFFILYSFDFDFDTHFDFDCSNFDALVKSRHTGVGWALPTNIGANDSIHN